MSRALFRELIGAGLLVLAMACLPGNAQAQEVPSVAVELDPESPMDPMADLGVAWPDMSTELAAPVAEGSKARNEENLLYAIELAGLAPRDSAEMTRQFYEVSTLAAGADDAANVAQIDRRAREDEELLENLLRARGYYDALVDTEVKTGADGKLLVRLIAEPGPLYRFSEVKVTGLESTGDKAPELRAAFEVDTKDPVDATEVLTSEATLDRLIKAQGFPFAKVGESDVVIDHDTRTATLSLTVEPGGERKVGRFTVSGSKPPFGADHVANIARFKTGESYDQARIDDLRRALVATGLVSAVEVRPVPGSDATTADIDVTMETAPLRTIAGEAGYGTGEGIRIEASWTHRNLLPPEGAVTFRGVAGTREQYLGSVLRMSNFGARDRALNARIGASNINRRAFEARTFEIGLGLERQSNIIWQKRWTWSVGAELLASDERDISSNNAIARRTFLIGAVPLALNFDRSDDLLDPTRGFRMGLRVQPELSLQSGTFGYIRTQIDGSAYFPAGKRTVVAGRIRLASIAGAGNFSIAPSRRLYAGGGGSVRGYGYQALGPRDAGNDPVGGRSLAEFALEARVRIGDFAVVPFVDGGNVYTGSSPRLSDIRFGAGLGVRYHSSFGPIRVDVGTPVNPRRGDSRVTVFVSLGQAF